MRENAEKDAAVAAFFRFLTRRGWQYARSDEATEYLRAAFEAGWLEANRYQQREGGPG